MPPASVSPEFAAYMAERFREYSVFEAAGLFWIGAELAILFAIAEAQRYLRQAVLPAEFRIMPGFGRRSAVYLLAFGAFCIPVIAAHFLQAQQDYVTQWSLRISIWCLFIVGWVALESLIVVRGVLAYNLLRRRLGHPPLAPGQIAAGAAGFLIFVLALSFPLYFTTANSATAAPQIDYGVSSVQAFTRMIEPFENGKLLLLRIAGVAWIAVEWVAAVVMCAGFHFLKRRAGSC